MYQTDKSSGDKSRLITPIIQSRLNSDYINDNWDKLSQMYRGKHVAVYNLEVVDNDVDFDELQKRLVAEYGFRNVKCMAIQYFPDEENEQRIRTFHH